MIQPKYLNSIFISKLLFIIITIIAVQVVFYVKNPVQVLHIEVKYDVLKSVMRCWRQVGHSERKVGYVVGEVR